MNKILKPLAIIAAIAVNVIPGVGQVLSAGIVAAITTAGVTAALGLAASALGLGPKSPEVSPANRDRLFANVDPGTPRKIVLGRTAMATDIRYQEWVGADQDYLHQIVCLASHKVDSVEQIWIEDELAWSNGVAQGQYAGFLTVAVKLEGTPNNTATIGNGAKWGNNRRMTGLAYLHMTFRVTGNEGSKRESPFAQSVPSRLTIVGNAMPVYDPRFDSENGGVGPMRPYDQSTWAFTYNGVVCGRNPSNQLLSYLLGWRITNPADQTQKLAVGRGIPAERFNMATWITAANACDESVALAVGGTEPRYRSDGIFTEADDPGSVISALETTANAKLRDAGGQFSFDVISNDLATPAFDFTDDDVLGDFRWTPTAEIGRRYNEIRGGFTDPRDVSLYQLVDYPRIRETPVDGIERVLPFNLPLVQSPSQAQRLAKQMLARTKYQGRFEARLGPRGWAVQLGDVVTLTFATLGWQQRLFRVVEHGIRPDGVCPIVLQEEHADIYLWDADERPAVQPVTLVPYDPSRSVLLQLLVAGEIPYAVGGSVEYFQPAEPGANVTGLHTSANTNAVGGRTATEVENELDAAGTSITAQALQITDIIADVDALEATYGSTASAAQSASDAAAARDASQGFATSSATAQANSEAARDLAQAAATAAAASESATASTLLQVQLAGSAVGLTENANFDAGFSSWGRSTSHPGDDTFALLRSVHTAEYQGRTNVAVNSTGIADVMLSKTTPYDPTRSYRLRLGSFTTDSSARVLFYVGEYTNATGGYTGVGTSLFPVQTINEWADFTQDLDPSTIAGTTTHINVYLRSNHLGNAGTTAVDYAYIEDITDLLAAEQAASASAASASTAAAAATAASTDAGASQTARLAAEAALATTLIARDDAVTAQQTATAASSTATTQANLAAGAATDAGNSATAAAGHVTTAQGHADAAGASASATAADLLEATTALERTYPLGFANGIEFYSSVTNRTVLSFPVVGGSNVLRLDPEPGSNPFGNFGGVKTRLGLRLIPGHTYEATVRARSVDLGTSNTSRLWVRLWPQPEESDEISGLSTVVNAFTSVPFDGAWIDYTETYVCPDPAPQPFIAAGALFQTGNTVNPVAWEVAYVAFDDVTERAASQGAATASAASASSAAASETAAGASATASDASRIAAEAANTNAQGAATASTASEVAAAGHASTAASSATLSATYRDQSQGHANDALTRANAAQSSATAASADAAVALANASLTASLATGHVNPNSSFSNWTGALPENWLTWAGGTRTKVTGSSPNPNAIQIVSPAGGNSGIYQHAVSSYPNGEPVIIGGNWYVLEADVTLDAGTLRGAGMTVFQYQADGNTITSSDPRVSFTGNDISGAQVGDGVVGQRYRFAHLWQADALARRFRTYAMSHYGSYVSGDNPTADKNDMSASNTLTWHLCGVRAATENEIYVNSALPSLEASVAVNSSAIATIEGRTTAFWQVEANAGVGNGATAFISARAETSPGVVSSTVAFGAREIHLYNPTSAGWMRSLSVFAGEVVVYGSLTASAGIFLGSGVKWQVALRSQEFSVQDGVAITYGIDFGEPARITFKGDGLAPLNSGETYVLTADNSTGTGFTPRLKISTPGGTTTYSKTADTTPGTGPTRQIDKGADPDASNNQYVFEVSGTYTDFAYYEDFGGPEEQF